jgi:hypothetical protein
MFYSLLSKGLRLSGLSDTKNGFVDTLARVRWIIALFGILDGQKAADAQRERTDRKPSLQNNWF